MSAPDLSLLGKRRFGPLFAVQFLGAFNDNLLKFALLFLANFGLYAAEPAKAEMLATVATGLFILPYFLFSAIAGQIADAWDKARLVRAVKLAEILIMLVALAGFWLQSVPMLLGSLFLMGMHSTLFGPVKYSILPQHLGRDEIMGGTGLIEAGTFIAIVGGQLLGGIVPPWEAGLVATGLAVAGFLASLAVPSAPATAPGLRVDLNVFRSTWQILKSARHGPGVWLSILGISWFFAVGAVLLAQFAPLVGNVLQAPAGGRHPLPARLLDQHRARLDGGEPSAQGRGVGPLRAHLGPRPRGLHDRPVALDPRLRARRAGRERRPVRGQFGKLADPRRPRRNRLRRRHVHRPALRDPSDPQPRRGTLAHHRREQHHQRGRQRPPGGNPDLAAGRKRLGPRHHRPPRGGDSRRRADLLLAAPRDGDQELATGRFAAALPGGGRGR